MILLNFITISISAQKVLKISDIEKANESFANYIEIFCDTTNSIDLKQIRSGDYSNKFKHVVEFEKKKSRKHTYWLHFTLENYAKSSYPVGIQIPIVNHKVDIYSISNNELKTQKTGLYVPGAINDEIIPFSNIIKIDEDVKIDYYLKIKNNYDEIADFQIKFINIGDEINKNNRRVIFDAAIQGMMWLMICYGLFLFILIREKLYVFYSLYVFFQAIFFLAGLVLGYKIIYNLPRGLFIYSDIFTFSAFIFYIQFIRSFVDLKENYPKWDKILKIIQYLVFLLIIGIATGHSVTNYVNEIIMIQIIIISLLMTFFMVFVIRLFLSKNIMARIIAIGTAFWFMGQPIMAYLIATSDDMYDASMFIPFKIGVLIELIIFTFGISYRYWLLEKDKRATQKKLIVQLNENAELQTKVNRELEEKVKERTAEVVKQKEDIQERNEELVQQKEEIVSQRDEIEAQRNLALEQKDQIEIQSKSVNDSIRYAQRIQSAILPPETFITELLHENFIFYKPRDIVSGDFYWIKQVNNFIILVAADCTGHGVPGAFMSMLGISYLNEMVQRREITQANQILNELRSQIKHSLRQHGQRDESKDGMDIALCVIDNKTRMMQYAGAFNPLYLIRDVNGKPELQEIKADRMPVGFYHGKDKSFTNHELQLEMGDTLYIFSDGFIDQIGGKNEKKYMSKNFKNLLLEIHEEPMYEQKEILDKKLNDWMEGYPQMDDILVVGVRI